MHLKIADADIGRVGNVSHVVKLVTIF